MDIYTQHFRVSLSFPGEYRTFVEKIAERLAIILTRDSIFYDKWYEAELAVPNLDTLLQGIYRQRSELVVVFLCQEYENKEWCKLEWRAVRDILKQKNPKSIMLIRFDKTEIPGLFSFDGYILVNKRQSDTIADLILKRLNTHRPSVNKIKNKSIIWIVISVIAMFLFLFYVVTYKISYGNPAILTVNNETSCQLGFYLQGPSARTFGVKEGSEETVEIAAGSYKFGVDTYLCPGKLPPLMGNEVFEAGGSYTLTLGEQALQTKTADTTGQFEIRNDTGAALTVKVGDVSRTVVGGSASISLPVGSYTATIMAKCGSTTESFEITQGETYTGKYWCEGGKVALRNILVSKSGIGEFVVHNDTDGTLTVRVGGESHSVGRGTSKISLPEGNYKASIVARCGSTTESLSIEAGSQYEGHYKCVSY